MPQKQTVQAILAIKWNIGHIKKNVTLLKRSGITSVPTDHPERSSEAFDFVPHGWTAERNGRLSNRNSFSLES